MRAIVQDSFGDPEVLRLAEVATPDPVLTEIRVRVTAAGVNPVDWKTRQGRGVADVLGEPPFTVGWDVAGVVDAIAPGVTHLAVGDRVFGMPWFPRQAAAYAEFVTAPSRHFAPSPSTVDDVHAGAMPLAALTAWQMLVDVADVQPGQRVLVHAAAGGVGHLAVQIAKARGAHVIGTASAAKHDFLGEIGVDEAVDRSTRFEDAVGEIDVVFDLIAGETGLRSVTTMRPGGIYLTDVGAVADVADAAAAAGVRAVGFLVEPDEIGLRAVADLVDAGKLAVRVAETFDLANAADAHRLGETGRTAGKLVLTG